MAGGTGPGGYGVPGTAGQGYPGADGINGGATHPIGPPPSDAPAYPGGYAQEGHGGGRPPAPRRRRRGLRNTVITLVVLGGLFVAADRLAVNFAESQAADKIKSAEGLTIDPEVSIKGFPFLTQALGKELDEVEVNLDGLTTDGGNGQPIRLTELRAVLHQVRIGGDFSSATADRATGRAHISYADLSAAAGDGITVSYAEKNAQGNSRVKFSGNFMGFSLTAYGTVTVVEGNTIRLHLDQMPEGIPQRYESTVRGRTDQQWRISDLPEGIKLQDVESTPDGVDISVAGNSVHLVG
ncbi:DUF2993 domain-containing protein [Streptomyces palmae]|uniref:DUF2993 domain-containing protein n=2 Tax=Streptomyces palmae TaxID=1701085 RepID=A0A4Z0FPA5_9ACTN|nr:DUF2993 domain-containing protein [Streptomyces palmae]